MIESHTEGTGADGRALSWDGCVNVRDLGGLPAEDGNFTRIGALVRADTARSLSDAGWAALVDYGVQRIVDLRFHSELSADPPQLLPVEVVHVPVLPELGTDDLAEIYRIADAEPDPTSAVRYAYLEFLERFQSRFARAIEAVSFAPDGTVLVHCMAGKDRTGLVVALLLRLAGVSIPDIAKDYALSAPNLRILNMKWIDAAENQAERRRRERVTGSPPEAMADVIEAIERRYGDVYAYLMMAGVHPTAPARARARLLASP